MTRTTCRPTCRCGCDAVQIGGYTCTLPAGHDGPWHTDEANRGTWIPRSAS